LHSVATYRPPSFLGSFSRAQVSSGIATVLDYGVLFLFTEIFHVWYVLATAAGALIGAVANFLINRHWSFRASHGHLTRQAKRYFVVSGLSLLLNTAGVYAVTELVHVHYALSVVVVSLAVGILFNFPLHRHYVYRS
jgi:putative flippase GtrA